MNWFLKINNATYFWMLCIACVLANFAANYFLYTDELYYSTYGEQFTVTQIQKIVSFQNSFWIKAFSYSIVPLVIIIRVLFTSFCLYVGNLVNESHWKFHSVYAVSLKADIVFLFNLISNFCYYAISNNYKTMEDLSINCSSLLKIVGKENIPNWLVFAYNSINLFELLYIVLLILFIKAGFHISHFKSVIFVLLTYCIGYYLYVVGLTFLYLNFS